MKHIESKSKTTNRLTTKINKINSVNRLQKFVADCYNSLGNIIKISNKRIKINNKYVNDMVYYFDLSKNPQI
jgi:hypothetical protein